VQAGWQYTSDGQILPHVSARAFAFLTSHAAPGAFPLRIIAINAGISICTGHAEVHGASKQ
jgi:hypothetical protein